MAISLELQLLGLDSDEAGSGLEALEKFKTSTYTTIIMDCDMAGMDGRFHVGNYKRPSQDG